MGGRGGVVVGIVGSPRPAKYVNVQVIRDVLEDVFVLLLAVDGLHGDWWNLGIDRATSRR